MTESDPQSSPFIKHLASSDKEIRDQALTSLRSYLSAQSQISALDLLKLWKGLYYCLWMQDKPLHQQRLARDLASLVESLQSEVVLPFLEAFWKTMAREWNEIGSLRMDKFMFLVRQYVNVSFKCLSRRDWKNQTGIAEYARILEDVPLNPTDMKIPNGLRYHILDIYVDELEKVAGEKIDIDVLEKLMEPVRKLSKESKVKSVRNAAKVLLDDDRLKAWRGETVETEEDDARKDGEDEEWGGIED